MKKATILVLIAVLIGTFIYFYKMASYNDDQQVVDSRSTLLYPKVDSIAAIVLSFSGSEIILEKEGASWWIKEPLNTLGNKNAITSLLTKLRRLKKKIVAASNRQDLVKDAFNNKEVSIELGAKIGKALKITIGSMVNDSTVYAMTDDSLPFIMPKEIKDCAEQNLYYWRDKEVAHFDKGQIKKITVVNTNGKFVFHRSGRKWMLEYPLQGLADQSSVSAILNDFNRQKIKAVVKDMPKGLGKFGLYNPHKMLQFSVGKKDEDITIIFSKPKGGVVYGKTSTQNYVFSVDTVALSSISKKLYDYRDKNILIFDDKQIDRVNLSYNDKLNKLYKDSLNSWYGNNKKSLRDKRVANILLTLKKLNIERFVEERAVYYRQYGLKNPRGKIELFSGDQKIGELDVGIEKKDMIYVRNPLNRRVFLVALDDILRIFPADSELYR